MRTTSGRRRIVMMTRDCAVAGMHPIWRMDLASTRLQPFPGTSPQIFARNVLDDMVLAPAISVAVGLSSVLSAIFIEVPVGIVSGFHGGKSPP